MFQMFATRKTMAKVRNCSKCRLAMISHCTQSLNLDEFANCSKHLSSQKGNKQNKLDLAKQNMIKVKDI